MELGWWVLPWWLICPTPSPKGARDLSTICPSARQAGQKLSLGLGRITLGLNGKRSCDPDRMQLLCPFKSVSVQPHLKSYLLQRKTRSAILARGPSSVLAARALPHASSSGLGSKPRVQPPELGLGTLVNGSTLPSLLKLLLARYAWMVASRSVTVTLCMWTWSVLTHLYLVFMSARMSVADSTVWVSVFKKKKSIFKHLKY